MNLIHGPYLPVSWESSVIAGIGEMEIHLMSAGVLHCVPSFKRLTIPLTPFLSSHYTDRLSLASLILTHCAELDGALEQSLCWASST